MAQQKSKGSGSKDWAFWLETKLVNGAYPSDSEDRLALSKKAFFLYVVMARRASLRRIVDSNGEGTGEFAWLTSVGRNSYVMDTGLPIESFDLAVKELEEKGFIRQRPDLMPAPSYLKGGVFEILPAPDYDPLQGFAPKTGPRDLGVAMEDNSYISLEAGERPVFFCPSQLVDGGFIKKMRTMRLLRLVLRLYSLQRLDKDMGIPKNIIRFDDIPVPTQGLKKLAIPNVNYLVDPPSGGTAMNRYVNLDRLVKHIDDLILEPMKMTKREAVQSLVELSSLGLVHFALVEHYIDPEDPDLELITVVNPSEGEGKVKKSQHKTNHFYLYTPRSNSTLHYLCQMKLKPNTVETVRYLDNIAINSTRGHLVQFS